MARPIKKGLDYFPMDSAPDRNMKLIQSRFGKDGFYITMKLLCEIYREEGYYASWDDDSKMFFAQMEDIDEGLLDEYIDYTLRIKMFDSDMFSRYRILTSAQIQETYFSAVTKRKKVAAEERFLLISFGEGDRGDEKEEQPTEVIDGIIPENDGLIPENDVINTQIKENKNKINKSISDKNKSEKIKSEKNKNASGTDFAESIKNQADDCENIALINCPEGDKLVHYCRETLFNIKDSEANTLRKYVKEFGYDAVKKAIDEARLTDTPSILGIKWYIDKQFFDKMLI